VGSSLRKPIKLLGKPIELLGKLIKLLGNLPVDRGNVSSVSAVRVTSLFDRSRTVVVSIV